MRQNILFLLLVIVMLVLTSCEETIKPPECQNITTYAEDPETGECKEFETTCTPEGWVKCTPVIIIEKPGEKIERDLCKNDADCVCGGIDTITNDCFVGNKEYYNQYVDKSKSCPDFCTGIAGDLITRCVDNKCQLISKQDVFIKICEKTGGSWIECGSGCGPLKIGDPIGEPRICPAVCIAQCKCPPNKPFWDDNLGCIAGTDEEISNDCESDGECILGIRIDTCCDCPGAYSETKVAYEIDLIKYEEGRDYSDKRPVNCKDAMCSPCLAGLSPRCISGTCQLVKEIYGFECEKDSDCVGNKCCHATDCIPKEEAPDCEGVICTLDCRTPLDCEASCRCVEGECTVVSN